jgi:hypothetical protein
MKYMAVVDFGTGVYGPVSETPELALANMVMRNEEPSFDPNLNGPFFWPRKFHVTVAFIKNGNWVIEGRKIRIIEVDESE